MGNYNNINNSVKKVIVAVGIAYLITVIVSIITGYLLITNREVNETKKTEILTAQLIANQINDLVEKEMLNETINTVSEPIKNAVKDSNLRQQQRGDNDVIQRYLLDMDKAWIAAPDNHPIIKEYIYNNIADKLRSIAASGEKPGNILITDKYGGLVASTERTTDFYQGNKDWWQNAFNNGNGAAGIGDIVFDERSQSWNVPLVLPIKDETGEVVGILRRLRPISVFFQPLEGFRMSQTSHAVLLDERGYLLFYPGVAPFSNKFCGYDELRKLLQNKDTAAVISGVYGYNGNVLVAFSQVTSPILLKKNINWYVGITESAKEISKGSNSFFLSMVIICLILTIAVLVGTKMIFTGVLVKPIAEIREGVDRIGMGDLDHRLSIKTGDAIETLADSINKMAETMKNRTVPVMTLQKEAVSRKKVEEELACLSSDFATVIAQLINTLLPVKQAVGILINEAPSQISVKHRDAINLAGKELGIIERNMNNVLDIARIEANRMVINPGTIDARDIIKKIVFGFEAGIRDRGLGLRVNIPKSGKLDIYADSDKITQVLSILIENAVNFTKQGTIEISARDLDSNIELCVIDTGIGMDRGYIQKIFEKNAHVGRISGEGKGLGLGLAIAKGIIELHNGKIWAESEPGKGTKFCLLLPKDKKI